MLTDIGGFLKIISLISSLTLGFYYRRILHMRLIGFFPNYERVLSYEGLKQMFNDISFLKMSNSKTEAIVCFHTDAIERLESLVRDKDQEMK